MKTSFCFVCLLALAAPTAAVTPVQKVITLMEGMLAKGKEEKHAEEVQFAAYKTFCEDFDFEKGKAIEEAEESIESLKADIQKFTADAERLTKEIAGHEADIAGWEAEMAEATKVRKTEKADYDVAHTDYSESVSALQRAIAVLKKQDFDRKQAGSVLMQVKELSLIPPEAKKTIDTFFTQSAEDVNLFAQAPEANAYEFQSSGIIDMLEKLLDKFIDEREALMKEEMNQKHAYEMFMQDMTSSVAQAKKAKDEKTVLKAQNLQDKADAVADLQDTTATMIDDKKLKADTAATCAKKASDFASRQQLRADELVAIEKAIEIISSTTVAGSADKYLPGLLQTRKALAQLRANAPGSDQQMHAAQFLQNQAKILNSRVLAALAVRAAADPFVKVKKMIKDLIVRLMEEANEEAEHKGWCDTELTTNEQTRKEKSEKVETLTAEIDELTSSIAQLDEDITALTKAVAELSAAMAEATKLRTAEKAKNAETVQDAKEAQTAVAQAIVVLKEFYEKANEATVLVQRKQAPAIFDAPYKGMQSENGGVIGMLEVIESDFARLESDTAAAEVAAQKEYDQFMEDSSVDKAAKTTESDHKAAKKQDQTQALTEKTEDREGTQKELDAALDYYEKLKPSCVDSGVSYEDRVSRRKEEIASLQEALKILNGEELA